MKWNSKPGIENWELGIDRFLTTANAAARIIIYHEPGQGENDDILLFKS